MFFFYKISTWKCRLPNSGHFVQRVCVCVCGGGGGGGGSWYLPFQWFPGPRNRRCVVCCHCWWLFHKCNHLQYRATESIHIYFISRQIYTHPEHIYLYILTNRYIVLIMLCWLWFGMYHLIGYTLSTMSFCDAGPHLWISNYIHCKVWDEITYPYLTRHVH